MRVSIFLIVALTLFSCKDDDVPTDTPPATNAIYLDSNGVTIKAYD